MFRPRIENYASFEQYRCGLSWNPCDERDVHEMVQGGLVDGPRFRSLKAFVEYIFVLAFTRS